MLVAPKRGEFSGRRQIDFVDVGDHDFVGLTNATALAMHIAKHATRLGVAAAMSARGCATSMRFARWSPPASAIAVVPEAAARRCAQSMPITLLAIRDSWANRQLVICARSFKSLPKPAKFLVEHLRKVAR